MSSENFRVRRANVDDLDALRSMWETMQFPSAELERRVTEFQVATDADGRVVGGIGFQMAERHAKIHSEVFTDFSVADSIRPLFWHRMQALGMNHGLVRLWTQETSPFWKQNGFLKTNAEEIRKLPPAWINDSGQWLTLPLKNEESIASMEQELSLFMAAEKQRTARALQHAKTMKTIATALAIVFAIFVGLALFYLLKKNPGVLTPGR
ncbi:MAG: hypothetical protein H7Y43_15250 [Akkermansiaceae bacterium]|nr:hypothetical protein [Verrucomicrobiales bacterium]